MTEICSRTIYCEGKTVSKRTAHEQSVHYAYIMLKVRNKFILFLLALLPLLFDRGSRAEQILITLLLQSVAFATVFIPAAISRHCMRWELDGKFIVFSSGIFYKKQVAIAACRIRSAQITKTPFLSLFKAVRLDIRSCDGGKKPEITLYLSPDIANNLVSKLLRPTSQICSLKPSVFPFLLMSASRANFAVGLSLLAAFLISFGKAADIGIPQKLYSGISETSSYILPYLSPVAAVLTACFFVGWFIHFLSICFSDARQVTTVSSKSIITVKGLISTRLDCIPKSSISSCEIRQTLLSMLFKQCSIIVTSVGQKKTHDRLALTAWSEQDYHSVFSDLTYVETNPDIAVKVPENARTVWWLPYFFSAALIGAAWIRFLLIKPVWFDTFSFFAAIATVLMIWKCCIGVIGANRAKLEFSGQCITISSPRAFSFHTQRIFWGKVAKFRITQTVLQKPRNLCTVYIRASGVSKGLKCRNLPCDMVCTLSERIK